MIAIFSSCAALDELRPNLVSGTDLGEPAIAADGRAAIGHPFVDVDILQLQAAPNVLLVDTLPSDWVFAVLVDELAKPEYVPPVDVPPGEES